MAELITSNMDELGDFWAKAVYRYLTPIVAADRSGRPVPTGTGLVVAVDKKKYLLTAHHVTGTHLPSSGSSPDSPLYALVPEQWEITGIHNYVGDPFDLSIVEIPATVRHSLRFPDHFAFETAKGELCLILGYPARSKSWQIDEKQFTLRPAPLSYLTKIFKTSESRFSVRLGLNNVYRRGKRLPRLGKLEGISGGGAFVIRNDAPKLAGIVIEYHSNGAEIVCTSSLVLKEMVKQL